MQLQCGLIVKAPESYKSGLGEKMWLSKGQLGGILRASTSRPPTHNLSRVGFFRGQPWYSPLFGAALKYSLLKPQPQLTTDTFIEFVFIHYWALECQRRWRVFLGCTWASEPPGVIKETYNVFIVWKKQKISIWILINRQNQNTHMLRIPNTHSRSSALPGSRPEGCAGWGCLLEGGALAILLSRAQFRCAVACLFSQPNICVHRRHSLAQ